MSWLIFITDKYYEKWTVFPTDFIAHGCIYIHVGMHVTLYHYVV